MGASTVGSQVSLEFLLTAVDKASGVIDGVGGAVDKGKSKWAPYKAAATAAATAVTAKLIQMGGTALEQLKEIETLNAQTVAAIKSTDGAAGVTAEGVRAYSEELESTTATSAEAIQKNANLLLTFTNVKNAAGEGNDVFNQSIATFTDMQRAVPSASMTMLGKALNDPIKGISALSKVGVNFTAQQQAQIKELVGANDTLGAQKIILGELNKEFGGSGAAYAGTLAGQQETLQNETDQLARSMTEVLLPAMKFVVGQLSGLAHWMNENQGVAQVLIYGIGGLAAVYSVLSIASTVASGVTALKTGATAASIPATVGATAANTGLAASIWATTWPILAVIAAIALLAAGVWLIIDNWDVIGPWLAGLWDGIAKTAVGAWDGITKWWGGVWGGIMKVAGGVWDGIKKIWEWSPLGFIITNWKPILGFFAGIGDGISNSFKWSLRTVAVLWNATVGSLSWTIPGWIPFIGGQTWSVPKMAVPALAAGGIVTGPTLALIGEAGDEAVVPLGRGGGMVTVPIQLVVDGKVLAEAVETADLRRGW